MHLADGVNMSTFEDEAGMNNFVRGQLSAYFTNFNSEELEVMTMTSKITLPPPTPAPRAPATDGAQTTGFCMGIFAVLLMSAGRL